ncbi:MAG: hypothetical protein JJU35_03580 [Balneolales bacterium]|nr:hypothetical protein [Balneolales bacterium]
MKAYRPAAILFITALLTLTSCLFNKEEAEADTWPLPALEILDIQTDEGEITFDVLVGVSSSGWEFGRPQVKLENRAYEITFRGIRPTGYVLPFMGNLETDITLPVQPGQTYTFSFMTLNEAPIDTTIAIPE